MSGKKYPTAYRGLAALRGFEWLGPYPGNTREKTRWKCSEGHEWEARYSDIQKGGGCPHCSGKARKIEADYQALATLRGLEWLGPYPKNHTIKTRWKCSKEHEWLASYNSIQQDHGCPRCANNVPKTEEDYRILANERDLEWLGPYLESVDKKTWWRCPEGHEWKTRYSSVREGKGCPHCSGNVPKTEEDYHALADSCGLMWLGLTVPRNTQKKTRWRCPEGHEWETLYNSIQQGHSCPHCIDHVNGHQVSRPQRKVAEMLGGVLNHTCERFYIDIALIQECIAIEYDCWYWHGPVNEKDAQRDQVLTENGYKVLHVQTRDLMPTREQLLASIEGLEGIGYLTMPDWGMGNYLQRKEG